MALMSRAVHPESPVEALPSEDARAAEHHDLHLLFECDRPLAGSTRHCLDDIDEVLFSQGPERIFQRENATGVRRLTIVVPDARIASAYASLRRYENGWALVDAASSRETHAKTHPAALSDGSTFELGHTFFLFRSLPFCDRSLDGPADLLAPRATESAFATFSHECECLFARLVTAARGGLPALLIGEAGSGKDTLARAIHARSGRRGAFIAIDCADLGRAGANGDALADIALHLKRASGGTLFLNEIEGLSPVAQLALLPVLRSSPRPCGAAIVSSVRSNHDLRPEVPRIRADLWAQLAVFTMPVQPLRERREDLGLLVSQILTKVRGSEAARIALDPRMAQSLLRHVWPYNLSELDGCVRTAVALSADDSIQWSPATLFHAPAPTVTMAPREELPAPRALETNTSSSLEADDEFAQNVRRALKCNLSVTGLQKNDLLHSKMVLEATKGSTSATMTVPALREIFLSAIETMRNSSPRGDKQSRVLQLTFIKPTATQQEAADRLAMAFGTYRRYVTSALVDLTSILWFNELSARLRTDRNWKGVSETNIARTPTYVRVG